MRSLSEACSCSSSETDFGQRVGNLSTPLTIHYRALLSTILQLQHHAGMPYVGPIPTAALGMFWECLSRVMSVFVSLEKFQFLQALIHNPFICQEDMVIKDLYTEELCVTQSLCCMVPGADRCVLQL